MVGLLGTSYPTPRLHVAPADGRRDSEETPPIPAVPSRRTRRFWGLVHKGLRRFAGAYRAWLRWYDTDAMMALPFCLVLKTNFPYTRVEEAVTMQVMRAAGMPLSKVLCYGEIDGPDCWPGRRRLDTVEASILMTRLPGKRQFNVQDPGNEELDVEWEGLWILGIERCLKAMREWKNPYGENGACSITGGSISSHRVASGLIGPAKNQHDLWTKLFRNVNSHPFQAADWFPEKLRRQTSLGSSSHV